LRKAISQVKPSEEVACFFKVSWVKLKMISLTFPSLKEICYLLLRQLHNLSFQEEYDEMMEYLFSSVRFSTGNMDFSRPLGWTTGVGVSSTSGRVVNHAVGSPLHRIAQIYQALPRSLMIPLTVFPRWEYRKESKLEYSFIPKPHDKQVSVFRNYVKLYLKGLKLNKIFQPPPEVLPKVGSSRYNDGGVEREDWERPKISWTSGFKWQSFNTKPLQTREVWLPDKATKISNSFWMVVGRQILLSDDRYPDPDPEVTWSKIKDRLSSVGMFDISAFGLQYPREYLVAIAECIAYEFPSPDIQEQTDILKRLFSKVSLQMPDGKFLYPPRGIGLGYYEDLKTIGIMAILNQFDIISLYGDQGIISSEDAIPAFRQLKLFGFKQKPEKEKIHIRSIKWSGRIMSSRSCEKPRLYLEAFQAIFDREFHWERKQAIASFYEQFPELKYRVSKFLVPHYPFLYGWEFDKKESTWPIEEGGISATANPMGGWLRTLKIRHLKSPRDQIVDNLVYSSPFFVDWKRTEAKDFQIKRKEVYKRAVPFPSEVWEYSNPKVVLNKTKHPSFDITQASVSEMMDLKLVAEVGLSLGKVTHNIFGDNLYKALVTCSRAPNFFEAFSTGGYTVKTVWRAPPAVPSESLALVERLYWNLDKMYLYTCSRREASYDEKKPFYQIQGTKRTLEGAKYPSWGNTPAGFERDPEGKLTHKKIRFEDLPNLTPFERKESKVENVSNILDDLRFKESRSADNDGFQFDSIIEDLQDSDFEFEDIDDSLYESLVID
jgi:hypothetical protein